MDAESMQELRLEGLFRHFDPRASGIVDFEGLVLDGFGFAMFSYLRTLQPFRLWTATHGPKGFKRGLGFMASASDQKAIVDQAFCFWN